MPAVRKMNKVLFGDCRDSMRQLIAAGVKVQCIVTSPPYWGLRDYGHSGQLGLEKLHDCLGWATGSPCGECHVCHMVDVFRLGRDLLADDGTLWLNYGDSYASTGGAGWQGKNGQRADRRFTASRDTVAMRDMGRRPPGSLKPKDICGIPWRIAFALQADGWYLRQDIIWHKPSPMPESITDRCTKAHEYLFLLSKCARYYFDADAIKEPASDNTHARRKIVPAGWATGEGKHTAVAHQTEKTHRKLAAAGSGTKNNSSFEAAMANLTENRNKRSVWTVASQPYSESHFATFPPALIEPCILAGSRPGDIVLDPFFGSGTTGQVAQALGRQWIGLEINEKYKPLQDRRTAQTGMVLV